MSSIGSEIKSAHVKMEKYKSESAAYEAGYEAGYAAAMNQYGFTYRSYVNPRFYI